MSIIVRAPTACSAEEIEQFCDLVRRAGEVDNDGLLQRIRRGKALAFLKIHDASVGIAALKVPSAHYRSGVFQKAKSKLNPTDWPFELGWVHVLPEFQGAGHSLSLSRQVLMCSEGKRVFATTKSTNQPMHRTLAKCSFATDGEPYPSGTRDEELILYVRAAPGDR